MTKDLTLKKNESKIKKGAKNKYVRRGTRSSHNRPTKTSSLAKLDDVMQYNSKTEAVIDQDTSLLEGGDDEEDDEAFEEFTLEDLTKERNEASRNNKSCMFIYIAFNVFFSSAMASETYFIWSNEDLKKKITNRTEVNGGPMTFILEEVKKGQALVISYVSISVILLLFYIFTVTHFCIIVNQVWQAFKEVYPEKSEYDKAFINIQRFMYLQIITNLARAILCVAVWYADARDKVRVFYLATDIFLFLMMNYVNWISE